MYFFSGCLITFGTHCVQNWNNFLEKNDLQTRMSWKQRCWNGSWRLEHSFTWMEWTNCFHITINASTELVIVWKNKDYRTLSLSIFWWLLDAGLSFSNGAAMTSVTSLISSITFLLLWSKWEPNLLVQMVFPAIYKFWLWLPNYVLILLCRLSGW